MYHAGCIPDRAQVHSFCEPNPYPKKQVFLMHIRFSARHPVMQSEWHFQKRIPSERYHLVDFFNWIQVQGRVLYIQLSGKICKSHPEIEFPVSMHQTLSQDHTRERSYTISARNTIKTGNSHSSGPPNFQKTSGEETGFLLFIHII